MPVCSLLIPPADFTTYLHKRTERSATNFYRFGCYF